MKIHLFKNEGHFYPRQSITFENGQMHAFDGRLKWLPSEIQGVCIIAAFIYALLCDVERIDAVIVVSFCIFALPLHEFSHVLGCLLTGNRVKRVCFFPQKFKIGFNVPSAYVMPEFSVWSKGKRIVLSAFPLLTLTLLPLIASVFFSTVRDALVLCAICHIAVASLDIRDIIKIFSLPKGAIRFGWAWFTLEDGKIFRLHRLYVLPDVSKIYHIEYFYDNEKLVEVDDPSEPEYVVRVINEFKEQFGLE